MSESEPAPPLFAGRPPIAAPGRDPLAATLLILGGFAGFAQLLLSWTSVAPSVGLPVEGGLTGFDIFRSAQAGASLSLAAAIAAYSVVAVAVAGVGLVVAGLSMLVSIGHRPSAVGALVLAVVMTGAAGYWVIRAHSLLGRTFSQVFADAETGWYLFLIAGLIGIAGSVRALRTR